MTRSLIATLLSSLMAFQVALGAGGMTCVTPSGPSTAAATAAADGGMAGMEMPSDDAQRPQPCDEPANRSGCLTLAPCAATGIIAESSPMTDAPGSPSPVVTVTAQPESRSSAPEPPPPRA